MFAKENVSIRYKLINKHDIGYYIMRSENNEKLLNVLKRNLLFEKPIFLNILSSIIPG